MPIGYVPDVVAKLPAHGIAMRTYVTCMFEYGKGYSGAGTDTLLNRSNIELQTDRRTDKLYRQTE